MSKRHVTWMLLVAVGAAAMFLFDPRSGRGRRAVLTDRSRRMVREAADATTGKALDLRNRARGLQARARRALGARAAEEPLATGTP